MLPIQNTRPSTYMIQVITIVVQLSKDNTDVNTGTIVSNGVVYKNFIVDWGDGSEVEYAKSAHTYEKAGEYTITFTGRVLSLAFVRNQFTNGTIKPISCTVENGYDITGNFWVFGLVPTGFEKNLPNVTSFRLNSGNNTGVLDLSDKLRLTEAFLHGNPYSDIIGVEKCPVLRYCDAADSKIERDIDITNAAYLNYDNGFLFLGMASTAKIYAKNKCQTKYRYDESFTGVQPRAFAIMGTENYEIEMDDGRVVTTKKDYFKVLAEIVKEQNLYDYPQLSIIELPEFSYNDTRDLYDSHKILVCDSGFQSVWFNLSGGIGSNYPTRRSFNTKHVIAVTGLKDGNLVDVTITYKSGATFYIVVVGEGFSVMDKRQRVVAENGVLTAQGGVEINTSENEDGSFTSVCTFPDLYNMGYRRIVKAFESTYPDEEDPYVEKIISVKSAVVANESNNE